MAEIIGKVFACVFGTHSGIATVIVSMFPIIELKGAIPIGMSVDYWGEFALSGRGAFLLSLLGSSLIVPIIALIFSPILTWLKGTRIFGRIGEYIEGKVNSHSKQMTQRLEKTGSASQSGRTILKCILIFMFVAVPLPLTGVWTGTCVAVAIGLSFWQACLSVILGNIVAGLIIVFVCSAFPKITTILSLIFIGIVMVLLVVLILKMFLPRKPLKKTENESGMTGLDE